MKVKLFSIMLFIILGMYFFTACDESPQSAPTGAFNDMQIIRNGYRLTVHSQSPGHPTPEADFETSFKWQNSDNTQTDVIEHFIFVESSIMEDYGSRDAVFPIKFDDKDMLYVREGEKQIDLIYEISDELYLKLELLAHNCFDCTTGIGVPFEGQMTEVLDSQEFLQSITFTVEEETGSK